MVTITRSFVHLSDAQLLTEVQALAAREREATAELIAFLAELDARELYLAQGFASLFSYCTEKLRLSEYAAYSRMEAARAVRKWPVILDLLTDGSITLTTVGLLVPVLTVENHRSLLDQARHKSKRELQRQIAALRPMPDVRSSVHKLPARPDQSRLPMPIPRRSSSERSRSSLRVSRNADLGAPIARDLTDRHPRIGAMCRPRSGVKCGNAIRASARS
jgi:hypothetical protein